MKKRHMIILLLVFHAQVNIFSPSVVLSHNIYNEMIESTTNLMQQVAIILGLLHYFSMRPNGDDSKGYSGRGVTSTSSKAEGNGLAGHIVWLTDESDGYCIGPHGKFSKCGDASHWFVSFEKKHHGASSSFSSDSNGSERGGSSRTVADHESYTLESMLSLPKSSTQSTSREEEEGSFLSELCLGRKLYSWGFFPIFPSLSNRIGIRDCKSLSIDEGWTFSEDSMKWSTRSLLNDEEQCLVRYKNFIQLQSCEKGFTPLRPILHTREDVNGQRTREMEEIKQSPESNEARGAVVHLKSSGQYRCAKTGNMIHYNLNDVLPEAAPWQNRQLLMGSGVFSITMFGMYFKVYTVAWYVEVEAASEDPELKRFAGLSARELSKSNEFYETMVSSESQYDRTLLIKLAMNLKKEVLIQGLLDNMSMDLKYAEMLVKATSHLSNEECPKGAELLLIWRKSGALEIIKDKEVVAVLKEPGLARDLFRQYILPDDPVSQDAKAKFVTNFPGLIAIDVMSENRREDVIARSSSSRNRAASLAPQSFAASARTKKYMDSAIRAATSVVKKVLRQTDSYIRRRVTPFIHPIFEPDPSSPGQSGSNENSILYRILIFIYCCNLIVLSLPPALSLTRPIRQKIKREIGRTISETIRKSKSAGNLIYSEMKVITSSVALAVSTIDHSTSVKTSRSTSIFNSAATAPATFNSHSPFPYMSPTVTTLRGTIILKGQIVEPQRKLMSRLA